MALPLKYHTRYLLVHRATTLLTVLVVAVVVGTFTWMSGFAAALGETLSVAGDPQKMVVVRRGSESEFNSALSMEDFNRLRQLEEIARDPETGEQLLSGEMLVQLQLPRRSDGGKTLANVAVRGLREVGAKVHRDVKIAGRFPGAGQREVIVGAAAARQFVGLEVGKSIALGYGGDRAFQIVGIFTAEGGPLESEIWGNVDTLMNAYNRNGYSSANLLFSTSVDAKALAARLEGPQIQLSGFTESEYWQKQAANIRVYLGFAYALVAFMFAAAVFAIANTMYATVAGRTREIAMLRTIGFRPPHILAGFLLESVLLCLLGGILGCLLCQAWLSMGGAMKDMYGATTFSTLAFVIRLTPMTVLFALLSVCIIGVLGAIFPARRAARIEVVTALRQT
ncbi:MAG: ABC transporter permease [Phycisphaerales bacterium]|nr:ABC transporter permease [Phycisphaerales bacterium]